MENKYKEKVLTIIGVMTLLLFGVGATFAYFVAQGGNAEQTNINVTTHTTDSLVFEVGKAISITADQTTFAPGAGNRSDNTFARATLKANSSTNSATEHYYVYLAIDTNEFKYTTEAKTTELILTITDPNGNPLTSINGLNYVTVGEVSGFDITEVTNLITIANNYEIISTGTKIDEWNITLTLVNLDANQNANAGKTFNATLLIQKQPVASQYIASLFTTQGANHLYHHNGTITDAEGNIMDAEDGSYRYAGGDYTIAPTYQDTYKRITKVTTTDTDALLGYMCGTEEKLTSVACTEETQYFYLTYEEGETKTQYVTYKEALAKLIEDGYLLETPVKNYVCFGSDEEICPQDNLYRIIGIIEGKVKLIKASIATSTLLGTDGEYSNDVSYYWNKINYTLANTEKGKRDLWSYSELNKTNLNKNYLTNIGTKWNEMIDKSTWYVGGMTWANAASSSTAKKAYTYELGDGKNTLIPYEPVIKTKVGLMYLSEYYYSATPTYWTYVGSNRNAKKDYRVARDTNWMYSGMKEWTISPNFGGSDAAIFLSVSGNVSNYDVKYDALGVRPTFYLKSSVTFAGGTGTETDPYRIA